LVTSTAGMLQADSDDLQVRWFHYLKLAPVHASRLLIGIPGCTLKTVMAAESDFHIPKLSDRCLSGDIDWPTAGKESRGS